MRSNKDDAADARAIWLAAQHAGIRGKWVFKCCEKITQAPVAPHVIDKGLPTTGLLAQVLVAKYLDHLPLYRQESIYERAGTFNTSRHASSCTR